MTPNLANFCCCWLAKAPQHTILYNGGKKPKFVECRIGFRNMIRGVHIIWSIHFCAMTLRNMHVKDKFRVNVQSGIETRWVFSYLKSFLFLLLLFRCLYFLLEVFIKVTNQTGLVMNIEEDKRFIWVILWLFFFTCRFGNTNQLD